MIELATGWLYTAGGGGASPDQTKKGHGVGTPHQKVNIVQNHLYCVSHLILVNNLTTASLSFVASIKSTT